jgi:hypothetical protein
MLEAQGLLVPADGTNGTPQGKSTYVGGGIGVTNPSSDSLGWQPGGGRSDGLLDTRRSQSGDQARAPAIENIGVDPGG